MARTGLSDIRSLPDPLQSWNWDIIITPMPGTADSRTFTYKAQSTAIPGSNLEQLAVNLHGVEVRYAGRRNYSHSWECTLLETRDVGTRQMMLSWHDLARNWVTNSGTTKNIYSTTGILLLYDDTPSIVRTIMLPGLWPETVGDSALDGQSTGLVTTSVTFSFDLTIDV